MASRRGARRIALDILYQADVTGAEPLAVLDEWEAVGNDVPTFARDLVTGVAASRPQLDEMIGSHAEEWTIDRMAAVDRSILRMACYELGAGEVPVGVAINEAVEAANELSTAESGRFVNGILGRIAREREGAEHP